MNIPCQIYAARHLLQVLWLACVLCVGTGCAGWHDARRIVQEADSMDVHGVLYEDTAALRQVINTWEKPVLRTLMHNDLGKAYYYLGRNKEDRYQQYTEAAKCYIRSDQLRMSDPVRRGRVNSCMGYLCSKGGEKWLNLAFAQRALRDFKQSKNDTYISGGLVYVMQIYGEMGEYIKADSIYNLLAQYELDSTNLVYLNMHRGWCHYSKEDYNSAMISFQRAMQFSCNNNTEERWRIYQEIMKTYYHLGNLDSAVYYAKNIIHSTSYPVLCANAYYILIDDATNKHDAPAVSDYAHKRADMQRLAQKVDKDYSQVASMLENHINSDISRGPNILKISIGSAVIIICIIIGILYLHRYHSSFLDTKRHASYLEEQLANINQKSETQQAQRRDAVKAVLLKSSDTFAFDSDVWNDDDLFCKTADQQLYNIYTRLHTQFSINIQDLKICILTLYGASRVQIATNIFRAVSSVPKLRANTAKKLGTTSSNLRTFLLDFLAS